ncbi:hypothetical protein SH139x_004213 [Planctomycetaceae bacterium SH139]
MRTFLVIVLIIVLLAIVGWIRFGKQDGNPTLEIDSDKVKQDTTMIWDEGRQAFDSISSEAADEEPTGSEKKETP